MLTLAFRHACPDFIAVVSIGRTAPHITPTAENVIRRSKTVAINAETAFLPRYIPPLFIFYAFPD
jgi:hypothetical protein